MSEVAMKLRPDQAKLIKFLNRHPSSQFQIITVRGEVKYMGQRPVEGYFFDGAEAQSDTGMVRLQEKS